MRFFGGYSSKFLVACKCVSKEKCMFSHVYLNMSYADISCFSFSGESGFGIYLLGTCSQKYLLKLLLHQHLNKFMEINYTSM